MERKLTRSRGILHYWRKDYKLPKKTSRHDAPFSLGASAVSSYKMAAYKIPQKVDSVDKVVWGLSTHRVKLKPSRSGSSAIVRWVVDPNVDFVKKDH